MDQQQFCITESGASHGPAIAVSQQQQAYCMFPPPLPPPSHTADATIRHLGPVPPSPTTLAASNTFRLNHGIAPITPSTLWVTPFTESPPMHSYPPAQHNSLQFGAQAMMLHHHHQPPTLHHNPTMTRMVQFHDPQHALQIQSTAEILTPNSTDQTQLIQVHPSDFQLFNQQPSINHGAPAWLSHNHHTSLPRVASPAFRLQHIPPQQISQTTPYYNESDLLRPVPMYRGFTPPGFDVGVSQRPLSGRVSMYTNPNGAFMPPISTPENYTINHDLKPELSTNSTKSCMPQQRSIVSSSPGGANHVDSHHSDAKHHSSVGEAIPEDVVEIESASKSAEEMQQLNDYREFAVEFKKLRCELGYAPADVVQMIGIRYGVALEANAVEQFESLRLELAAIKTLKPIAEMWVRDASKAAGKSENEINDIIISPSTSINPKKDRKHRTSVDEYIRQELEYQFSQKAKPSPKEMQALAFQLRIERDFIRVWFCNRRQRQKKAMRGKQPGHSRAPKSKAVFNHVNLGGLSHHGAMSNGASHGFAEQSAGTDSFMPKNTIASPSHDITIEVPLMMPNQQDTPTQAICISR